MVGAGKVRIGDVGQKRCETRGNAKAPAWLSAEPQTEGVWTGSVTQKTPSPHPSCLTLTHTWCYLWRPQILPRPAERQLAASLPKSCPSQAWKPSDLTKLHGLPTNQQGDVPPPPSRNQAWRFMLERLPTSCTASPSPHANCNHGQPPVRPPARQQLKGVGLYRLTDLNPVGGKLFLSAKAVLSAHFLKTILTFPSLKL